MDSRLISGQLGLGFFSNNDLVSPLKGTLSRVAGEGRVGS
jgi:hypothetical protein